MESVNAVQCLNCGEDCPPQKRRANPRKYCSEACRLKYVRRTRPDYAERSSRQTAERQRIRRAKELANRPLVSCPWCGEQFKATHLRQKYCCPEHSRKHEHRKYRQRHGRFAVTEAERMAIYERDNWTCQLCGNPVDKDLHYLDSLAATLDHIVRQSEMLIPDHSPENLRLAHRGCNAKRG